MKRRELCVSIGDRINEFIAEKKAVGLSNSSLENYRMTLKLFLRDNEIGEEEEVTVLTKSLYDEWVTVKIEGLTKANSLLHHCRGIRVFYYYLMERGDINFFKIKLPSLQKENTVKRYTDSELSSLLTTPKKEDPYWVWRDFLLCSLMVSTGARIGSLCNLKTEDITDSSVILNKTKNKKPLVLPLSSSLKSAVIRYKSIWDLESEYLLLSSKEGRQLTTRTAYHSFEKYCELRGVEFKGLHTMRHTFAYNLYKSGVDIVSLQYLLGHSNIGLTRAYIGSLCGEDLPDFVNPLDRILNAKPKGVRRK